MTDSCPRCGRALAPDAPAGQCPQCLLRQGLATESAATTPPGGFVAPDPEDLAPHFPQLEILALHGKGGMGAVYKARQPGLERIVALKILPRESGTDPSFAERFVREARALARLNHPNIVSVFDFGHVGELYYFVMEFVEGTDLRHLMRTGLESREALEVIPQICDALQYAHEQGIVHRDVKPENILVDRQGRVKIADFGLAKLLGDDTANFALTSARDVLGTLHYMAPEQLEKPLEVDHRADIYSLGVVFYEMLTGELPIGRFDPPSRLIEVDVRLDEVVLRALAKEPDRRYQTVSDLKTRVESIGPGSHGPGPHPGPTLAAAETRRLHQGAPGIPTPPPPPPLRERVTPPRLCLPPVFGALLIPVGLALAMAWLMVGANSAPVAIEVGGSGSTAIVEGSAGAVSFLGLFLLVPILGIPFLSTMLGCIGISQIRRSEGRLYGMLLAVGVALCHPLLVLDGVLVFIARRHGDPNVAIGVAVLCLVLPALLAWLAWRAATKPTARAAA